MSFGSAFAAARSQVGAEGVSEWRGNYYSTYTKEEWDAMDADARGEYMQKYYETDMNAETDMETETEEVVEAHEVAENMTVQEEFTVSQVQASAVVVESKDVEVEFVVEETVSSDVVFGQTEGHDTMFVDADGDGAADYMVVDVNDDGEAGYDEIHDVSDEGIMMSDLG
jgi:acetolactate synthase regulatory subunit